MCKRMKETGEQSAMNAVQGTDQARTVCDAHVASDRLFVPTPRGWLKTKRIWLIVVLLLAAELIFHVGGTAIKINAHYYVGCSVEPMTWENSDWRLLLIPGLLELLLTCGALFLFQSGKTVGANVLAALLLFFSVGRLLNIYDSNKVYMCWFMFGYAGLIILNLLLQCGLYPLLLLILVASNKAKADMVLSKMALVFTGYNLILAFGHLWMDSGLLKPVNLMARLAYLLAMLLTFKCDQLLVRWRRRVQR